MFENLGKASLIAWGIIFLAIGILLATFTITDMILNEQVKMRPSSTMYRLWLNPQSEVILKAYIFTAENANEFLSGADSKIRLKEFGPLIYREHLQHQDVVHHDNSTLS